jgi:DNA-binding MltR family transcriptional regulator
MEDNSELHPESLRIQCKKAIEVIEKENDAYEELISKLRTNIVENDTMSGETADSIKAYASDLICVVEYAIKANEMDKADHQILLDEIDSVLADKVDVNEVLRGYDIHDEISYLENQISVYETRSQVEIQVLGLNAIMEDEYADQIEDLNKVLQDMHNKEERYDTIEVETKGIFSDIGEIREIVSNAIYEMKGLFVNNEYKVNKNSICKSGFMKVYITNKYKNVFEYLKSIKNDNGDCLYTDDEIISFLKQLDNNKSYLLTSLDSLKIYQERVYIDRLKQIEIEIGSMYNIKSSNDEVYTSQSYDIVIPETVIGKFQDGTTITLNPRNNWSIIGGGVYPEGVNIDSEGRYCVAVGPAILDPNYPDDGNLWKDEFDMPVPIDVYLKEKDTEEVVVIHCVVTDIKAHTFNDCSELSFEGLKNGIIQTGIPYPKTLSYHNYEPNHIDGSVIEFCGHEVDFVPDDYEIEGIIIEK